jgi:integrase
MAPCSFRVGVPFVWHVAWHGVCSGVEFVFVVGEQIGYVLCKFDGHPLYPIAVTGLASGLRRGEVLALRLLVDVDLDSALIHVQRSLEETQTGLRFNAPKTAHGRRTVSLPPSAVAALREHRRKLHEMRLALGLGKPDDNTLLFGQPDGAAMRPNQLSWLWRSACKSLRLPSVSFHALRHTHASALIAAGLDVMAISRRLGHSNPTVTLNTYGHLFRKDDRAAANAIETALRTRNEQ